jgi:hypothetical protein
MKQPLRTLKASRSGEQELRSGSSFLPTIWSTRAFFAGTLFC